MTIFLLTEMNPLEIIEPSTAFLPGTSLVKTDLGTHRKPLLSIGTTMPEKETTRQEGRTECRPAVDGELDLERFRSAVRGIRYGEVRVVIQDGVIVQIERVERQRLR
jgi:hypothetical protein